MTDLLENESRENPEIDMNLDKNDELQNMSDSTSYTDKNSSESNNRISGFIGNIKRNRELLVTSLGILAALISLATVIYYIIGPAKGFFHSDCTDTLYWAEASYSSGKILSDTFVYAAILPFSASIWFIPLISMFGVTMLTHTVGMVIFALLFAASAIFLFRSMKLSWAKSSAFLAALLLLLSSSKKLREIMWEHVIYYSLGLMMLFIALGLAMRILDKDVINKDLTSKKDRVKTYVLTAVLVIFTALSATNGLQGIAVVIFPTVGAIVAERLFDSEKLLSKKNIQPAALVVMLGVAAVIGMILLKAIQGNITAPYADVVSTYDSVNGWVNNLLLLPQEYFKLLGVDIASGTPIADIESIKNLVRIASGILFAVMPFVLVFRYNKIRDKETKLVLWAHIFVSAFILFGWIFGQLSGANWRIVPMVGTSIIATFAAINHMFSEREIQWKRVAALAVVFPILFATLNFNKIRSFPSDYGQDSYLYKLTDFLEDKNFTYGYATFWYSQAITVISDSNVKCRMIITNTLSYYDSDCIVSEHGKDGFYSDVYQNDRLWYEDQEGVEEYFVLLTSSEYKDVRFSAQWLELTEESFERGYWCDGNYNFYEYDVSEGLKSEALYYIVSFNDNVW